jgi:hypothetical protein
MDPIDLSQFVADRRRLLETEAAAERLRRAGHSRRLLAAWLRGLADRLDPVPSLGPVTLGARAAHAKSRP